MTICYDYKSDQCLAKCGLERVVFKPQEVVGGTFILLHGSGKGLFLFPLLRGNEPG